MGEKLEQLMVQETTTATGGVDDRFEVPATIRILGKHWTMPVLRELYDNPKRRMGFMELQDRLEKVSSKVLSERLSEMVDDELLRRREIRQVKPMRVKYYLTDKGSSVFQLANKLVSQEVSF